MAELEQALSSTLSSPASTSEPPICGTHGCENPCKPKVAHPFTPGRAAFGVYRRVCALHYEQAPIVVEAPSEAERQRAAQARHIARREERRRRFAQELGHAGLEKLELKCRFGNFERTAANGKAYTAAFEFARGLEREVGGRGVFLIGAPGIGKTHLAASTLKVLKARGKNVAFYKVTDMLGYLRSCFRDASTITEEEAIEELGSIDVLFLDDFGVERTTDYAIDALYRVIDRRYRRELPIFATSNLSFAELKDKLDVRIPSRLASMCRVISYKEEDRRLRRS
ncbi:MAG: ATP-binding protein [Actinomycetota bacterium]|nr:ATP-binding protein [Actinomycetota bacterium]